MASTFQRTHFSLSVRAGLVTILLLTAGSELRAANLQSNVVCRDDLSVEHRNVLAAKLQRITGWSDLGFEGDGALQIGREQPIAGSQAARELLSRALTGPNVVILEDASGRSDVVFCRVVPGKWRGQGSDFRPVWVVLIDFADFQRVTGDQQARAAFDVGWGLLHELEHVVNDSNDPDSGGAAGECEARINAMRRELGLPVRTDYFFTSLPLQTDPNFPARFVRLAFEAHDRASEKTKRYWLVWDAVVVGGLNDQGRIAAVRSLSSRSK